jgi:chemotaxis protein histidine kinase CheA
VSSWWNIILIMIILLTLWWNNRRKKKKKSTYLGIIIIYIASLFLFFKVLDCVVAKIENFEQETLVENEEQADEFIEEVEETKKIEEKQRKLEEKKIQLKEEQKQHEEQQQNQAEQKTPAIDYSIDRDCSDFTSEEEATRFMKASIQAGYGNHRLDRDGDGKACDD